MARASATDGGVSWLGLGNQIGLERLFMTKERIPLKNKKDTNEAEAKTQFMLAELKPGNSSAGLNIDSRI